MMPFLIHIRGLVRVSHAGVYLQLLPHVLSQFVLGKHTPNGKFNHTVGMPFDHSPKRNMFLAPHITRVREVRFLVGLAPRQCHLLGVDHHDVIPHVQVRCIHGLVLATENSRDTCGQPAQGLAFGIDEPPTTLDMFGFWSVGLHRLSADKSTTEQRRIVEPFRSVNGVKYSNFMGFGPRRFRRHRPRDSPVEGTGWGPRKRSPENGPARRAGDEPRPFA